MRLRFTADALYHIEQIHRYIAERNPAAAIEVVARISAAASRLRDFPHIGRPGMVEGTREWVVRGLPYIIAHQIDGEADELLVLGVFHGARARESE